MLVLWISCNIINYVSFGLIHWDEILTSKIKSTYLILVESLQFRFKPQLGICESRRHTVVEIRSNVFFLKL